MSRRVLTVLIVATMFVAFMPEQTAAQRGLDSASTSFVLPGDRPVRIMPVGDSNTKGRGSDVGSEEGWEQDDPLYVGYREALGELLAAAGVSFEFVGSQTGDGAGPHEGYGGKTPTYIASSIFGLLQDNPADVVLLMIGTNDLKSDDVKEILNRIDEWEQANHPVMVFMALIVNRKTTEVGERYIGSHQNQPGVDTHDFNSELRGIADDRPSDYLAVVDMERGFGIDYREAPAGHMSRDLPHLGIPSLNPNDLHLSTAAKGPGMLSGHEKVAHAWMTALCQELFGCPIVDSFTLVNADTDEEVGILSNGDSIDLAALGTTRFSIVANSVPATVGRVQFDQHIFDVEPLKTEHTPPYAAAGDFPIGDYNPLGFVSGESTVILARPFSSSGVPGPTATIEFTVDTESLRVNELVLVDADAGTDLLTIDDGDTIDLAMFPPRLNLRAVTSPAVVDRVEFDYVFGGQPRFKVERFFPYALGGDSPAGNFLALDFPLGTNKLKATPFAMGNGGDSLDIEFIVINSPNGSP